MCPDPSLLVAYLDGTLFHRDASAIDAHVETCDNCTSLLEQMRRVRDAEQRAKRSRTVMVAAGLAVVVATGIGTWFVLRRTPQTSPMQIVSAPSATTTSVPAVPVGLPSTAPGPGRSDTTSVGRLKAAPTTEAPVRLPSTPLRPGKPDTTSAGRPTAAPTTEARVRLPSTPLRPGKPDTTSAGRPTAAPTTEAPVRLPSTPLRPGKPDTTTVDGDVVLRGRDRRIVWRTRDRVIEHSVDGGVTWTIEHTADRPVRAGAFVDSNVAWLAGDDGLVLRRTKNGWFGTSPPAARTITAVRASSPSKATVTLDDGRLFRTENGGVTWSAQ